MGTEKDYLDNNTTSVLLEALEGEFIEILKEYMETARESILNLRSIAPDNREEIISIAHALKGSSGNIGAAYLSSVCNELENGLRLNQIDDVEPYILRIEETFKGTCILLDKLIHEVA